MPQFVKGNSLGCHPIRHNLSFQHIQMDTMKTSPKARFYISLALLFLSPAAGFGNALFQKAPVDQQTFASKTPNRVEIELPNFEELFDRVQEVSPLARLAIESNGITESYSCGFDAVSKKSSKWLDPTFPPRYLSTVSDCSFYPTFQS